MLQSIGGGEERALADKLLAQFPALSFEEFFNRGSDTR
jgi:hypothetical protein